MVQNKEKSKSKPYGMSIITGYVLMHVFACWGKMSIDKLKVHEIEPNFQGEKRGQDPVSGKWIAFEKERCLFFETGRKEVCQGADIDIYCREWEEI